MKKLMTMALVSGVALLPALASAHTTFKERHGVAGSKVISAIQVGHGCTTVNGEHLGTKKLIVEIPDGVKGAQPYAKPGWDISVVKGMTMSGSVDTVQIIWEARNQNEVLPNDVRDEFTLSMTLPSKAAMSVYFPTTQVCSNQYQKAWVEIPMAGEEPSDLAAPAPRIVTTPSGL